MYVLEMNVYNFKRMCACLFARKKFWHWVKVRFKQFFSSTTLGSAIKFIRIIVLY